MTQLLGGLERQGLSGQVKQGLGALIKRTLGGPSGHLLDAGQVELSRECLDRAW